MEKLLARREMRKNNEEIKNVVVHGNWERWMEAHSDYEFHSQQFCVEFRCRVNYSWVESDLEAFFSDSLGGE